MAKFCRSCGTQLEVGALFCGECGAPVVAKTVGVSPSVSTPTSSEPMANAMPRAGLSKRGLLIGTGLVAIALIGGGATWWLTQPEELTEAVFLREAKQIVKLNPSLWDGRFCVMSYVDYRQPEIRLRNDDMRSRKWFEMLAADGLYTPAQQEVFNNGYTEQTIWVFQQTDKGKAALRNGQLCYASAAEFTTASFTPPSQVGSYQVARGQVNYQVNDAAAWSQSETAKAIAPEIARQNQGVKQIELVLVDRQWQLPTPELIQSIRLSQLTERSRSDAQQSSGGSWFASILNMFNAKPTGIAALFGRWESDAILGQELMVELDSDSISIMGQRTASIRYLPSKNSDWVRVKNEQNLTLIELKMIDESTLRFRIGGGIAEGKLYRQ